MFRRLARLALLCGVCALPAFAGEAAARASKHAAMAIDANTGAALHDDDGDARRHPASLTKMMTLYLTFEAIEQGRLSMSSKVLISQEAASVAPSKLDLDPGESLSVRDAILALITKSANDVAVALAEKIGGSERNFVRLMNAKARELGMSRTNFENPSGLPDPDQVTTARDMITLGLRLQDHFPQHYGMFATRAFRYGRRSYRNHNTLMNSYAGIDGIKTGYTRASGFNLVSSVRRNGRHVVAAVLGGASAATRNGEMRVLLTRALNRASTRKTRRPDPLFIAKLKSEPKIAKRREKPKQVATAPAAERGTAAPAAEAIDDARSQISTRVAQAAPEPDRAAAPAPAASPPAPPPPQQAQAGEAPPAAPIEVTKVRRIMVAPRQGPARPAPSPDETTDMAAYDDTSGLPQISETIIPKTTPVTTPAQVAEAPAAATGSANTMAGVTAPASPEPQPHAAIAETAPAAQMTAANPAPVKSQPQQEPRARVMTASLSGSEAAAGVPKPVRARPRQRDDHIVTQRGLPPSSLEAQAAALRSGASMPRTAAYEPAAGGRFEIQIGAYASLRDAQTAIDAVQTRAAAAVGNHPSVTHPVDKGGRTIYRARFRGFNAASAASACASLRQHAFDCFVMTAN